MFSDRRISKILPIIIFLILTAFQLTRIIAFINIYGGIEHDGGWALTISRSLVEYGTYTTTVSTIVDPTMPAGINIDREFDIQTPDGRIWFRSSNPTGPASIVPTALILKLFGTGYWAMRAGPLLFYTLFLFLAAYILYKLAGLGAIILFNLFIFFYPHLSIFLSYQALGEVPGIVYTLGAYLVFAFAIQKNQRRWLYFFITGLIIGLAISAKLITLWSVSSIIIWTGSLWLIGLSFTRKLWASNTTPLQSHNANALINKSELNSSDFNKSSKANLSFSEILCLGSGTILILGIWELVQWIILIRLTNFAIYLEYTQERIRKILDQGSGVRLNTHSGSEFFWDKFFRLEEITHPQRWVTAIIFIAIFVGGMYLIWLWRNQPGKQNLLAPIWLGWLVNTVWFVGMAKTAWPRHIWMGLILAVILLCVITVMLIFLGLNRKHPNAPWTISQTIMLVSGILLLILISWGFVSQPHVRGVFLQDDIISYWQEKQINEKYDAYLPWIIIPRSAQAEIIDYIDQLPPESNVYFPDQHKAAEISALTGRIFYPINRRPLMQPSTQDIAIIGPSLIAPWMNPARREALRQMVQEQCPQPIISNDYYMLCPFPAQ